MTQHVAAATQLNATPPHHQRDIPRGSVTAINRRNGVMANNDIGNLAGSCGRHLAYAAAA